MVALGPPFPLACTPDGAPHDWFLYSVGASDVVSGELKAIYAQAPSHMEAIRWEATIEAKFARAREGRVPRDQKEVERTYLGQCVYELKSPLDSTVHPPVVARLYNVDVERFGQPAIGCFLATVKEIHDDPAITKQCQDEDIQSASERCSWFCSQNNAQRLSC